MTRILEKMSLLGLSLLLISAFSISTALPPMLDYYSPTFSAAQVELLVSVPSFSVVAMLLLNSFIDKWLSDRQLIVTGLLLLSSAGIFPFFVQAYPLVLLSRIAFGMGIGLINAKAIAIISQRYQGKERVQHRHQRRGQELFCRGGVSGRAVVRQTGDNPIGVVERRTEGCSGVCNRNGPWVLWLRWCKPRDIILFKRWFGAGLHRNKRLI